MSADLVDAWPNGRYHVAFSPAETARIKAAGLYPFALNRRFAGAPRALELVLERDAILELSAHLDSDAAGLEALLATAREASP